ncbi:hypothetical protein IC582_020586 [Cucumis melo]|uniref:Methylesterase 17 n=2 Tax=Cucumis melo TaxID=3656 RepID=A0A1S3CAT2_CUCME|nr:methylesterase 17 [Cucumis melo]KAA0039366.1 methylesterase 17 [Cucumis melo var. makuwa]
MGEKENLAPSSVNSVSLHNPPHFVLVHGIGGGGWCWYKIRCLMENSGFKVTCIDLKGAGIDLSDPNSVINFDDYNQPLLDFISSLPENEQIILVGHSAGGLSITQATLKFAKKIRLAVYVAATMLRFGFQTDQDIKDGVPDLSEYGDIYNLEFGLGPQQPPTTAVIKREFQRKVAYHMSPHEDSTLAAMLLRPGPIQALMSAQFKEEEDREEADKVKRVYIRTMYDRVIKPEQQEAMIKGWPPEIVYEMDTDHSPFFSNPSLLFGLLIKSCSLN